MTVKLTDSEEGTLASVPCEVIMMIAKAMTLGIVDYEILTDAGILVSGMTGVIEETNNGKTSIVRAIYSAVKK